MSTEALCVLYLRFEFGFWFGGSIFSVNIKIKVIFSGKREGDGKGKAKLELYDNKIVGFFNWGEESVKILKMEDGCNSYVTEEPIISEKKRMSRADDVVILFRSQF